MNEAPRNALTQLGRLLRGSILSRTERIASSSRLFTSKLPTFMELAAMTGWAILVPSSFGAAMGAWLDDHYRRGHSWTFGLFLVGLSIGCFDSWNWSATEELATLNKLKSDADPNDD